MSSSRRHRRLAVLAIMWLLFLDSLWWRERRRWQWWEVDSEGCEKENVGSTSLRVEEKCEML